MADSNGRNPRTSHRDHQPAARAASPGLRVACVYKDQPPSAPSRYPTGVLTEGRQRNRVDQVQGPWPCRPAEGTHGGRAGMPGPQHRQVNLSLRPTTLALEANPLLNTRVYVWVDLEVFGGCE